MGRGMDIIKNVRFFSTISELSGISSVVAVEGSASASLRLPASASHNADCFLPFLLFFSNDNLDGFVAGEESFGDVLLLSSTRCSAVDITPAVVATAVVATAADFLISSVDDSFDTDIEVVDDTRSWSRLDFSEIFCELFDLACFGVSFAAPCFRLVCALAS